MNANDWKRYGDIEFEDGIEVSSFLVDVSELLWGDATCPDCEDVYNCDCENRREPFTIEESIERLRDFNKKSFAWEQEEKENQIKELKMLVVMLHGDRELGVKWQDMANEILLDNLTKAELVA
tara:strand:- start:132 stop:500 length:369 start_codon:yes stop_codon:yes gene_type:complete